MNNNGKNVRNITNNPSDDGYPSWSPDGSKIAFASTRHGKRNIYTMNSDGSKIKRITNDPVEAVHPSWSPGSDKLLFSSDRDSNRDIYLIDINSMQMVNLTNSTAVYNDYASWSPDGDKILFASDRLSHDSNKLDLFIMDANGTNPKVIRNTSSDERHPAWSPDGDEIAFTSDGNGGQNIFIINIDGTGLKRLTPGTFRNNHPSFVLPYRQ